MSDVDVEFDAEIVVRREMGKSLIFLMVRSSPSENASGIQITSTPSASANGSHGDAGCIDTLSLQTDQANQQIMDENASTGSAGEAPGLLQITLDQCRCAVIARHEQQATNQTTDVSANTHSSFFTQSFSHAEHCLPFSSSRPAGTVNVVIPCRHNSRHER
jgi:hypothetical protein